MELKPCSECNGSGFSGRGSGYDAVCGTCGGSREYPAESRPTPQMPDDVVEAMCAGYNEHKSETMDDHAVAYPSNMQAALTAAAAMGYHLAPDGRTLPKLPHGFVYGIIEIWHAKKAGREQISHRIPVCNSNYTQANIRAAVLAAIGKIDGGKG